jgi:predicted MFS family arabinose efflux permease
MPIAIATRLRIFLPFAVGYFLSYLYRTINSIIGPDLAAELGIDPSSLGLLTAAYFITFAAFQLPLGILLDRYGPRRIEAFLLLFAAAGAFVFANAQSLWGLVVGRGLIGLGVSACLMAAFKAFVIWFPVEQLPRINGYQMAAGGLGALAATTPVEAMLAMTDWRGVFRLLSLLTLLVAAAILLVVPRGRTDRTATCLSDQLKGIGEVATSLTFWRIAPWTTLATAGFQSMQGLWAGPWLRDVAGMDRTGVAGTLLVMAAAMVLGHISLGTAAERLSRHGVPPMAVAAAGMGLFMLVELVIMLQWRSAVAIQWFFFGFFGAAAILPYAVLSQSFPPHLAGRVNTALNLLVFVSAFSAQWGMGAIINLWPVGVDGGYTPAAYPVAIGSVWILQLLSLAWYLLSGRLTGGRSHTPDSIQSHTRR